MQIVEAEMVGFIKARVAFPAGDASFYLLIVVEDRAGAASEENDLLLVQELALAVGDLGAVVLILGGRQRRVLLLYRGFGRVHVCKGSVSFLLCCG